MLDSRRAGTAPRAFGAWFSGGGEVIIYCILKLSPLLAFLVYRQRGYSFSPMTLLE